MTTTTLSEEKLFAYLIVDDIQVDEEVKNKAKEGDGESLGKIGNIYFDKKDYTKAIDWYRLGTAKDNAHSQFRVGGMYHYGQGVSIDYKLAMKWYLKAHNNGNLIATNNIGFLYGNGKGVAQDYKTALNWFLEAANKGYELAQYNVGVFYENGHGVEKDIQHALEWYEKSAEQGYEDAKDQIKRLNEQGYYLDERHKRYLQIEKDLNEKMSKEEEQKLKIESLENNLKLSELKRLDVEQEREKKDDEIKLLKQEMETLKSQLLTHTRGLTTLNEDSIDQLEVSVSQINTSEEDPQNDIYYDE